MSFYLFFYAHSAQYALFSLALNSVPPPTLITNLIYLFFFFPLHPLQIYHLPQDRGGEEHVEPSVAGL